MTVFCYPNCHTKLKKNCENCNRLMELPWNICPYYGTPAVGSRRDAAVSMDEALRGLKMNDEENGEAKGE